MGRVYWSSDGYQQGCNTDPEKRCHHCGSEPGGRCAYETLRVHQKYAELYERERLIARKAARAKTTPHL